MRVAIILLLLLSGCGPASGPQPASQSPLQAVFAQPHNSEVARLLKELCPEMLYDTKDEKDEETRNSAKKELLALAAGSVELKAEIIHFIGEILDTSGLHLINPNLWHDTSDLLSELGGPESIDILIKHLDYTDVLLTLTLGNKPTIKAVIRINEPAVPKLIDALMHGGTDIKASAAFTLSEIGSDQAKAGLERALKVEKDESITDSIKISLETISKRRADEAWRRRHDRL